MREFQIVMTLIEQGDNYVFQRRDLNPLIGAAGLIGCFGGKIEEGESPSQAAARETNEETNLQVRPDDLEFLGAVDVVSDFQGRPAKVNSQVFKYTADPELKILAADGEKVSYPQAQIEKFFAEMTPATRAMFEHFILTDKK